MVGHPAWSAGVVYVDLFAGPGVCEISETAERFPGSPVIAARAPKPFRKILLCEVVRDLADACEARLTKLIDKEHFTIYRGDCNKVIDTLVAQIPRHALTLAFLDPTGLHLSFETVEKLAACGRVDLLILFPDAYDILRNEQHLYFDQPDSNLDRTLGRGANWRERVGELKSTDKAARRKLYATIYKDQLRSHAGYEFFEDEVIRGPQGPLYRLIYATKDERGVDFWRKSVARELSGQIRMFP
jgi:three-Cys-motif partner protein